MASSSKRPASSAKQSIAGKTRVISVGRNDALPRKGNLSAGPRKPIVRSPVDAAKEPLPKALARSHKKPPKLQQTETSSSRIKTAGTRGRGSAKLKKPAATEVIAPAAAEASGTVASAVEPEMVTALNAIAETVGSVTAATTPDEMSATAVLDAPGGEALPSVETEVEVEAPAIVEHATIVETPVAPRPHDGKRALATAASRLLSMLCRWTGVRR
jgi:hypothetical protein